MKNIGLRMMLFIGLITLLMGAVWGKNYYEDRYIGSDYYAQVPTNYIMTPETIYDNTGKAQDVGKHYKLIAYNEIGESKEVNFTIYGEDQTTYPQPGDYLLINASNQIVIGQQVISEKTVPDSALSQLRRMQ